MFLSKDPLLKEEEAIYLTNLLSNKGIAKLLGVAGDRLNGVRMTA